MSKQRPLWSLRLLGGLLALYLLLPFLSLLLRAPGALRSGALTSQELAGGDLGSALITSVTTATVATLIVTLLGVPLGYWLARGQGRLVRALGVLIQLPLAMPPLVAGLLLILLVGPYTPVGQFMAAIGLPLTDGPLGIILAQCFVAAPFLVIASRSAFQGVDPCLAQVAQTLGDTPAQAFWRVELPLARPGLLAGLALTWLRAFGEFGATMILAYHPYTLPVYIWVQFSGFGLERSLGLALCAALVAAVGVLLADRLGAPRRRGAGVTFAGSGASAVAGEVAAGREAAWPGTDAPPSSAAGLPLPLAVDVRERIGPFTLKLQTALTSPRVALLGPSGAGKSLTVQHLAGLRGAGLPGVRVGYVPQQYALFPHLTVAEHLAYSRHATPERAAFWLQRLGLGALADRYPHQLSGGQQQRVALGRALASGAQVLLLDEPFSALDSAVRRGLRRELRALQRSWGGLTILITHDPEEAALLAEQWLILLEGRLVQSGAPAAVSAHPASPAVAQLVGVENVVRSPLPGLAGSPLWCARAAAVRVAPLSAAEANPAAWTGRVLDTWAAGQGWQVEVQVEGVGVLLGQAGAFLAPGAACQVAIDLAQVHTFVEEEPA